VEESRQLHQSAEWDGIVKLAASFDVAPGGLYRAPAAGKMAGAPPIAHSGATKMSEQPVAQDTLITLTATSSPPTFPITASALAICRS
jgi:hypothetical protein